MPAVAKDRERLELSLPSSKSFAEAHASSIWAESSAQPSLGSVTSSLHHPTETTAPLTEVNQDFLKISWAWKMLQLTIEKQRLEEILTKELNYLGVITLDITISPEVL